MTDPDLADATYIEPITPEFVEKIIEQEKPDALLPTMGGQTALNTAMELAATGVLETLRRRADRRQRARRSTRPRTARCSATRWPRSGSKSPRAASRTSPRRRARRSPPIGLPAIIRPSFTLGGTGGGIAYNREEFDEIVQRRPRRVADARGAGRGIVLGWKEYEMEVVRDSADNCIIVCSIENLDPMGIHTGDSITVAPAQTLTDKEYQIMRDASIACMREIGVDTGGSNVQFAVNPADRPHGRHRDEPARLALLGAGLEGDRLPDRQGRGASSPSATRSTSSQRHHRRRRRPASSRRSTTSSPRSRASPSRSSPAPSRS